MGFLKYLGLEAKEAAGASADTDSVRRIVDALDRLEPERARFLAGFAYILSRAARADLRISEMETRSMERIVAGNGGLPEEQAVIVVQIAKTQNKLFGATEDFLVTREYAKAATRDQKLTLLDCLFAVAAAEDLISAEEDGEIRQIARELGLEHPEFIAVRSRYRDKLSVLQRPGVRDISVDARDA
jgi:uncharacterized tellurite resistance protein B-like protein